MKKYDSQKDYYEVLGVSEEATEEEIDKAYRSEARTRHPDGGGSEEAMKSLNEARDILRDPETRKAYDAERRPPQISYGTSAAYDPEAASNAGTLKIPVADEDMAGLVMGAATCFVIGLPLLLLIEISVGVLPVAAARAVTRRAGGWRIYGSFGALAQASPDEKQKARLRSARLSRARSALLDDSARLREHARHRALC